MHASDVGPYINHRALDEIQLRHYSDLSSSCPATKFYMYFSFLPVRIMPRPGPSYAPWFNHVITRDNNVVVTK